MDYKSKYIKYKIKYLEIKKGGSLTNKFITELKKLYPECKYDLAINKNYDNYKITYGEISYDGFDTLLQFFDKNSFESFIDVGSGRGKICLYAAALPSIKKSVGIELVIERHDDALKLASQLLQYPETSKVEFINDDFFNCNFINFHLIRVLVWLSNLCFDDNTNNKMFNKLANELPVDTIIGCSKEGIIDNLKIIKIGEISIKMSWSNNSTVYLYKIK